MPSKSKAARLNQKGFLENKLEQMLTVLAENGLKPGEISRDARVKGTRAKIRKTNARLKAISALEKKAEEMARIKAEKAAAPKEEKDKKKKMQEETAEKSKRQQKKKKKKESKEKVES
jgi:stringent starvation protein B